MVVALDMYMMHKVTEPVKNVDIIENNSWNNSSGWVGTCSETDDEPRHDDPIFARLWKCSNRGVQGESDYIEDTR